MGPVAVAAGVLVAIIPRAAQAHEKWFIDSSRYPLRWDLFVSGGSLTCACVVAALVAALAIAWHARGRRDFIPPPESLGATAQGRRIIYALLPLVIGLHTAIALFYNGSHGVLLSPNIQLHGAAAYICGVVEIGVGLSLFYGGLTRIAAFVLIALWIAGIPLAGIQSMLDNALYLGIGVFFFLAGRGPI
ncbi:MAG: DoxX protein, partial [Candidatus Eremiobacteraeota bacterium]|nr:DoxX protein [Candidatus Eremiobacteraeota bacterium]